MEVKVSHVILDYVGICEKRREILNFDEFIELWIAAKDIAEQGQALFEADERH